MNEYTKKLREIASETEEEIKLSLDDWNHIVGGTGDTLLDICTHRELIKNGYYGVFMGKTLRVDKGNPSRFRRYNVCG